MKKLKAFTLLEMTISMVISLIVVSSCSWCFLIFFRQFSDFKITSNSVNEVIALQTVLQNDLANCEKVIKISDGEISLIDAKGNEINYNIGKTAVVRNNKVSPDTFHIILNSIQLKFAGEEQLKSQGLIDEIILDAEVLKEKELFSFQKQYAADVLMEIAEEKPIENNIQ
jgi:competence protein ComGF